MDDPVDAIASARYHLEEAVMEIDRGRWAKVVSHLDDAAVLTNRVAAWARKSAATRADVKNLVK